MSLWPEAKGASLALSQWLCRRRTTLKRGGFAVNYPLSKKEQKKRIDHDPRLAKKILSIVGAAVLALLIWLDHQGY